MTIRFNVSKQHIKYCCLSNLLYRINIYKNWEKQGIVNEEYNHKLFEKKKVSKPTVSTSLWEDLMDWKWISTAYLPFKIT